MTKQTEQGRKYRRLSPRRYKKSLKYFGLNRELLSESFSYASKLNIPLMAGSLAFTTVLSIVPLLAVMFYVFKLFGGFEYVYDRLMPYLLDILSEGTGEVVAEHLANFVHQTEAKAVGWAGVAGLLITSLMTYLSIVRCFNMIWKTDRPLNSGTASPAAASIQHRMLRAITLITIGPMLMAASIAITTAVAAQIQNIPFSGQLLAVVLSAVLFALVYSLVPMVKIPLKIAIAGSIFPAILLETAKFIYAIYTSKMVTYSAFYGSFAAIPLFLLWVYIAWCITLYGAVWVYTIQKNSSKGRTS